MTHPRHGHQGNPSENPVPPMELGVLPPLGHRPLVPDDPLHERKDELVVADSGVMTLAHRGIVLYSHGLGRLRRSPHRALSTLHRCPTFETFPAGIYRQRCPIIPVRDAFSELSILGFVCMRHEHNNAISPNRTIRPRSLRT